MKKSLINFKNSLSTKLSLLLVFFTTVILVTALVYLFTVSHNAIRQEAINHATEILENTTLRVNSILNSVELAARNSEWLILRHLDNPDSMFVYSRHIINNNPDLNGCSIAFEPDFFNQRGHYFSAFSYNDHGTILTTQEGNEHYEYFYMDWYQLCKLLDRPVWTEPFFDYNPVEIYPHEAVASYCVPIKDPDGKYVGTMSLDVSLEWLSNTISAVKPYPNSYNIMIGQGGTFFVHPDSTKLFYQTIFTETLEHEDTALAALGHAMQRGEKGMRQLVFDGQESYVFYKPIENTGWSVAIVCPESDIFGAFNRLQRAVAIAVIGGLLLLLIVCLRIISHELKPLRLLAEQAGTIAKGNFDETLPDSKRTDEIGQLSHSFSNMQQSLAGYIEELKLTTAQKASIENELKVASDIQMSMVPRIFPPFPDRSDIDLYAYMTPAKEVGGDLYDFFIQDERLYFCVGDVSGKGIPASLLMAVTRNLFRIVAQQGKTPVEIATRTNLILSHDNEQMMFVTMFIGCADLRTGHLDYCNCGHNAPLIDGQLMNIKYTNRPLGIMEEGDFVGESIDNIRSRQILIYTDGLTEAENTEHQLFGDQRTQELVSGALSLKSEQVILMLQEEVERHRNGATPNDDLTLLCLKLIDLQANQSQS